MHFGMEWWVTRLLFRLFLHLILSLTLYRTSLSNWIFFDRRWLLLRSNLILAARSESTDSPNLVLCSARALLCAHDPDYLSICCGALGSFFAKEHITKFLQFSSEAGVSATQLCDVSDLLTMDKHK